MSSFDRISCNGAGAPPVGFTFRALEMFRILAPGGILAMYEPTSTPLTNAFAMLLFGLTSMNLRRTWRTKKNLQDKAFTLRFSGLGLPTSLLRSMIFSPIQYQACTLDLPLSRSRVAMKLLTRIEQVLGGLSVLRPVLEIFSWRLLVVAVKPPE